MYEGDEYVFVFSMGTDVWLISLTNRYRNERLTSLISGVPMQCVAYPDNSW